MKKLLLVLSTTLLSVSAFANPAMIQQQQAVGYYMSTCGGPTPAHCGGGNVNNGGSSGNQGPIDTPVVAIVWAYNNAKATNMPLFYTVYAFKGYDVASHYLSKYAVKHCQETYGGTCQANSTWGNGMYLAVASTHPKGTAQAISTSVWVSDANKKQAEKEALEECRMSASEKGLNPNNCKIILNKRLDKLGSEVPSHQIANAL